MRSDPAITAAYSLLFYVLVPAAMGGGCVQPPRGLERAACERIAPYVDDRATLAAVRERRTPVFISGADLWVCPCESRWIEARFAARDHGGASEMRRIADDEESRRYGTDDEARRFGRRGELREYDGQLEDRFFGIEGEQRDYGGSFETRRYGDDAERRRLGQDQQARRTGTAGETFLCNATPLCVTYQVSGAGPLRVAGARQIAEIPSRCMALYVRDVVDDPFAVDRFELPLNRGATSDDSPPTATTVVERAAIEPPALAPAATAEPAAPPVPIAPVEPAEVQPASAPEPPTPEPEATDVTHEGAEEPTAP